MENKYRTYKYIKNTSGLKKYDPGMTPISSGSQYGDYSPLPSIDKPTDQITSPYRQLQLGSIASAIPQFLELGKSLGKTISATRTVNNSVNAIKGAAEAGTTTAESNTAALGELAKLSGAAKAANVASNAIAAPMALYGAYKTITDLDQYGRAPVSGDDLMLSAGKYYAGNGAMQIGDIDSQGVAKTLREYNNLAMTDSILDTLTLGSSLGTLAGGPVGAAIGSAISLPVGFIAGLINRGKAKQKLHLIQEDFAFGKEGFNRQSYAEASNQLAKNSFYNAHYAADKGLKRFDGGVEPALMGPLETQVETYKDPYTGLTRIKNTYTPNETNSSKWRNDNILTVTTPNTAIIGNNKDKDTGVPFSLEALPAVEQFNSANPYESQLGEQALLNIIDKQSKKNKSVRNPKSDNDPGKYGVITADKGLNMKKCDTGDRFTGYDALKASRLYNILPATILSAAAYKLWQDAKSRGISDWLPIATEDPAEQQAINRMGATANINPLLDEILNAGRYLNYIINNSPVSSGQKTASRLQTHKNTLDSIVAAYAKKAELDQQSRLNQASAQINSSARRTLRIDANLADQRNRIAKAVGEKNLAQNTYFSNMFAQLSPMFQNMRNDAWQLALNNLYEQLLTDKLKDSLNNGSTTAQSTPATGKIGPGLFNYSSIWNPASNVFGSKPTFKMNPDIFNLSLKYGRG